MELHHHLNDSYQTLYALRKKRNTYGTIRSVACLRKSKNRKQEVYSGANRRPIRHYRGPPSSAGKQDWGSTQRPHYQKLEDHNIFIFSQGRKRERWHQPFPLLTCYITVDEIARKVAVRPGNLAGQGWHWVGLLATSGTSTGPATASNPVKGRLLHRHHAPLWPPFSGQDY